ncbi:hypothetical protein Tco_1422435 [Tanacetum coccineum]
MGGSSGIDDEGFIEVKRKKSGGNIGGTKHFKPVSVKPKPQYLPKVHQSTEGVSPKMAPCVGKKNLSTLVNSSKMTSNMTAATSRNGTFSISNSFEALNFDNLVTEDQCVLVDDEGNPLEMVDYSGDRDNEDEVLPVDNEMTSFLASKTSRVGYSTNSLLEQWRETYGNVDYDYDPYDDDIYEGH